MKNKIILLFAVFLFSVNAWADERITRFNSTAWVNTNATVRIEEEISVVAEHRQIRRGIYRELPSSRKNPVQIESLTMDGVPHPYFTERADGNLRINFGDDNYIAPGPHTYRLVYSMANVIRFFDGYDEFYWNVTGNGWNFPIETAAFSLHLPAGAQVDEGRISLYTGAYGSRENEATGNFENLSFWTTRPLQPYNGFTVAVPFAKGLIMPPVKTWKDVLLAPYGWGAVGLLLVLLWVYYLWAWNRVGRDPQARVLRQFEPPEGLSPAQVGYVYRYGKMDNLFPVVLVSLAVKGVIKIQEKKDFFAREYTLKRLVFSQEEMPVLAEEETAVFKTLFPGKQKSVPISQDFQRTFVKAGKELQEKLKAVKAQYFSENLLWTIPTYLVFGYFAYLLLDLGGMDLLLPIAFFMMLAIWVPLAALKSWFMMLYAGVFVLFIAPMFFSALREMEAFPVLVGVVVVGVSGSFFVWWIKAYTRVGRQKMDQIEGFKEYLKIGEGGRVAASNPTDAEKIFCDYLPYAYALGVEKKWISYFERTLSAEMVEKTIRSRGLYLHDMGGLGALSCSLGGAMSSSGSGSGGGGFSGGGCGGGGGGGR